MKPVDTKHNFAQQGESWIVLSDDERVVIANALGRVIKQERAYIEIAADDFNLYVGSITEAVDKRKLEELELLGVQFIGLALEKVKEPKASEQSEISTFMS